MVELRIPPPLPPIARMKSADVERSELQFSMHRGDDCVCLKIIGPGSSPAAQHLELIRLPIAELLQQLQRVVSWSVEPSTQSQLQLGLLNELLAMIQAQTKNQSAP